MTDLLERALRLARDLPAAEQDLVARLIFDLSGDEHSAVDLTSEEESSLSESLGQAGRGEFATEAQVRAVWAKHGL